MDFEKLESYLADLLVEWKFEAKKIKTIPGTLGLVYVMENAPNTLPRFFAVKTINPRKPSKLPRPEVINRFKRELEHWYAYGDHPLILRPFYIDVIGNWPFVAMPFCEQNLRDYMDRGSSNIPERLAISIQVCHGLLYTKSKGLIAHQDMKPANILLEDLHPRFTVPHPLHWQVRISDFGLANAYSEIGIRYGSRPYMAPEQHSGDHDFSKVDVFALGVILTELFSGRHPIGERTPEVWPHPNPAKGGKWKHEAVWNKWASGDEKIALEIAINPGLLRPLFERMLLTDPRLRPELEEVEKQLMAILGSVDQNIYQHTKVMLQHFDQSRT